MMKVGILTQPLGLNYGGILQNLALQHVLRKLGVEPVTISYRRIWLRFFPSVRKTLTLTLNKLRNPQEFARIRYPWEKSAHTYLRRFARQHVALTPEYKWVREKDIKSQGIDRLIVGSDQVWYPPYNKSWLPLMFGDFLSAESRMPIAAYAASFGTETWRYTPKQEAMARRNIGRFSHVSVREDFGVRLAAEHFNTKAMQTLDPSMLVDEEEYMKYVPAEELAAVPEGRVGVFILDITEEQRCVVDSVCVALGKKPLYFGCIDPETRYFGSIENWLASFHKSDFIITDSFHGTAFAINFHKPFLALMNEGRGAGRFTSLLSMFGLPERLIQGKGKRTPAEIAKSQINWADVQAKLLDMRSKSMSFLKEALEVQNSGC